ncbi:MAG: hypothetical protein ACFE8B_04505 [Candidatus Hermodarchaeota archaeon]
MKSYDFDPEVQKLINNAFSEIKLINWKQWLDITTREEFEELSLKNSGLDSVDNLFEKIVKEKSNSRDLSVDLSRYIFENQNIKPLIMCHSSGTTNSNLDALKWFHMSEEVVKRQWAPGMQAIFESSGLNSESAAVIFVPSRMKFDGIQFFDEIKYISLYSSEFSQRVMLSILNPKYYLLNEYKNSKKLEVISQILSLEDISVISAPAATILSWANLDKLKEGLNRSLKQDNYTPEDLKNIFEREDLTSACKIIQEKLSDKLSQSTLIFSISSLSESDWSLIRKFMKWEKGNERFTNLYVVSEIGPFASSITKKDFIISRANKMYVFPLTLPVIEHDNRRELITRTKNQIGKLLVSRLHNSEAMINIDLGDVISLADQEKLPKIHGRIRRSCFKLKYPIKIAKNIPIFTNYSIYAGDYIPLEDFRIIDPGDIVRCLSRKYDLKSDSMLLTNLNEYKWVLYIAPANFNIYEDQDKLNNTILTCSEEKGLSEAIEKGFLEIKTISETPIDFIAPRSEILTKVRNGKLPKGILKRWPLYLLRTAIINE